MGILVDIQNYRGILGFGPSIVKYKYQQGCWGLTILSVSQVKECRGCNRDWNDWSQLSECEKT